MKRDAAKADHGSESHRAMISVKGGMNVSVAMVRDFGHVIDRETAKR